MTESKTAEELGLDGDQVDQLINAIPAANYAVTVRLTAIESNLNSYTNNEGLDLEPDFQRGHVWTQSQQIAYCESFVRGVLGESGKTISFNSPTWATHNRRKDSDLDKIVCIDGLQRLTALRKFMEKEFKIFPHIQGGVYWDFFNGTSRSLKTPANGVIFKVFDMQYKKDILDYYLSFNGGGTPHSQEEINRIINMRKALD